MPPTHTKKPKQMCAHGGPLQCSEGCYSKGGSVEKYVKQHDELQAKRGESYGNESKGVHSPSYSYGRDRGASMAGDLVRGGSYKKEERLEGAKDIHRQTLRELKHDKTDRRNLADGGDVSRGFNGALGTPGIQSSIKNLSTKPKMMADGGEPEPLDEPMQDDEHEEMESVLAGELLHAMEKKDKKGVAEAIEALVLQCMNKGGM